MCGEACVMAEGTSPCVEQEAEVVRVMPSRISTNAVALVAL